MIDHVSIPVSDLKKSAVFYEAVLGAMDYRRLVDRPTTVGFGKKYPELWLNARPGLTAASDDSGHHVCLRVRSKEAVIAFHEAGLAQGGHCDGPPGPRQAAMTPYFAAFIRDPDGNKIEAATFPLK